MSEVLTTIEREALNEFKQSVYEQFPQQVRQLLLFGSRARGDSLDDSDVDIMVVVQGKNQQLDAALRHVAYAIEGKYDYAFILSVKTVDETVFGSLRATYDPFYRSVKAEGISL